MKPLFLILKKQYFDQIESGEKTTEFRAMTDYWVDRLAGKNFETVIFQNGYSPDSPRIQCEIIGIRLTETTHEFFGNQPVDVIAIDLKNPIRIK